MNQPREIQKITENWKAELDSLIQRIEPIDKQTREKIAHQFNLGNKLISFSNVLRRLTTTHNELDETLNQVIDEQNEATMQLDIIYKELLQSKGLEKDTHIQSIDEIYRKAEEVKSNTKEIETNVNSFVKTAQQFPRIDNYSLSESLRVIHFLDTNMVIFI